MSRVIDHTKWHKILAEEEEKKKPPMPDLDKILPPDVYDLEETLTEKEFDQYVIKHFNKFYSKYVNSSVKDLFVNLPIEFFTKENIARVRWYANIAFDVKAEMCKNDKEGEFLPTSEKYYEKIHAKFLEMLIKKNKELLAKTKHEQTLYL